MPILVKARNLIGQDSFGGGVARLLSDKQQQRDVTGGEETRENTPLFSFAADTKADTLV